MFTKKSKYTIPKLIIIPGFLCSTLLVQNVAGTESSITSVMTAGASGGEQLHPRNDAGQVSLNTLCPQEALKTTIQAKIVDQNPDTYGITFGEDVAISGATAIITSTPTYSVGGDGHIPVYAEGYAEVYTRQQEGWLFQQKLIPGNSDGSDDNQPSFRYGTSVAMDGDTAVITSGGYYAEGAYPSPYIAAPAYIYIRNGGTWKIQQKLDLGGSSAALKGDTAVIGSPDSPCTYSGQYGEHCGEVYVYIRNGDDWNLQQTLTAQDTGGIDDRHPWDRFGASVALSEDTIIIGAPNFCNAAFNPLCDYSPYRNGVAYVYRLSKAGLAGHEWFIQQKVSSNNQGMENGYGSSVALTENTAVIGSPKAEQAYVYSRTEDKWSLAQTLVAPYTHSSLHSNLYDGGFFGASVSASGDRIMIGQPKGCPERSYCSETHGAGYLYAQAGSSWQLQEKIFALAGNGQLEPPLTADGFGSPLSLDQDQAIISYPGHAVYIYGIESRPARKQYTLTVAQKNLKKKNGAGTVSSSPGGIDCGSTCIASFDKGTTVTLTALPFLSKFKGWSGSCIGKKPCRLKMLGNRRVSATFVLY